MNKYGSYTFKTIHDKSIDDILNDKLYRIILESFPHAYMARSNQRRRFDDSIKHMISNSPHVIVSIKKNLLYIKFPHYNGDGSMTTLTLSGPLYYHDTYRDELYNEINSVNDCIDRELFDTYFTIVDRLLVGQTPSISDIIYLIRMMVLGGNKDIQSLLKSHSWDNLFTYYSYFLIYEYDKVSDIHKLTNNDRLLSVIQKWNYEPIYIRESISSIDLYENRELEFAQFKSLGESLLAAYDNTEMYDNILVNLLDYIETDNVPH